MSNLTKRNTFTALTTAQASQVNENFDDLVNFVNNQVVHADGSKAMTGRLTGPNLDPVADNDYARKKYVDDHTAAHVTDLADKVEGVLPVANGGTGAATAAAARTSLAIRAGTQTGLSLQNVAYTQHTISASGITSSSRVIPTVRTSTNGSLGCQIVSVNNNSFVVRVFTNSNQPAQIAYAIDWIAVG